MHDVHKKRKTNCPNNALDTGRKLNAHKTFGRLLKRLLNVLCTFRSSPVSRGIGQLKSRFERIEHLLHKIPDSISLIVYYIL